jgi:Ca-activated chloride channel family protein
MSQISPMGPRGRYAPKVAVALALGMFSLGVLGCGGGTGIQVKRGAGESPAEAAPSDFNPLSAEQYGAIVENEFRSPLVEPRSTFSSDVNTASYSNVRRFVVQQNQLPPRNAVLLAELVNYFPYSYPRPTGDDPVSLTLDLAPCAWKPDHKLVRIGVRAKELTPSELPPRNLVFLIDTSGSMDQDNRLPLVKQSLGLLVETLTDRDRVGIVTYAGDSRVALRPTGGSDKRTIMRAINGLNAAGGTNGEGGIRKAYDLAGATFLDGGMNRVILCTDGDFNVGVTDQGELVRLIEDERRSKVFLTILGYGMGNYKDATLKELANHGNGHHAYIDTLDEAKKVFVEQGAALTCVAKDVKFQADFNPARVNAYRLIGYENRLLKPEDFKNDAKDAGDMGSGHTVTALYEIVPAGVKIDLPAVDPVKYQKPTEVVGNADEWLTVKMRYKHPESETSKELSAELKGAGEAMNEDFRFASAVPGEREPRRGDRARRRRDRQGPQRPPPGVRRYRPEGEGTHGSCQRLTAPPPVTVVVLRETLQSPPINLARWMWYGPSLPP